MTTETTPIPNPVIAVYSRSGYPAAAVDQSLDNYQGTAVNVVILSGPNGNDGEIVYNDPPNTMFDATGAYVGDTAWPDSLRQLRAETDIAAVYFSLSNSAISTLAAMGDKALAAVMTWLKANGIDGIDMDCESWGQPGGLLPMAPACQTVTRAAIAAKLSLTAAPYNAQSGWQSWCAFVAKHGGTLAWLNLQCYCGGYGNDPAQWYGAFSSPVPVVAGVEANPGPDQGALTPAQTQTQLQAWQSEAPQNYLAGAFVWEYSLILSGTYTVAEFAEAMVAGLG